MFKGLLQGLLGDEIWLHGLLAQNLDNINIVLLCLIYAAIALVAYLLGSLNTAIVISKLVYGEDIRTKGSGNAGMTNMMRTYGKGPAFATFAGDLLKTLLALLCGTLLLGLNGAYIAGLCAVLGHVAPLYYRFKGGKGVAVTTMFVLYAQPFTALILTVIFVFTVYITKFLSLASVLCAFIYPLLMFRLDVRYGYVFDRPLRLIITLVACLIVIYMHRSNMKRLLEGTENKFSFKKTQKKSDIGAEPRSKGK